MAESVTIARPYAEAVFRLAKDGKTLPTWSIRLKFLALVAEDPRMASLITDPSLSAEEVARIILSMTDDADPLLANLVSTLAENERLVVLPQISTLYEVLKSDEEGVREALIASAFPLDDTQLANLISQLETHFKSRLAPRVTVDTGLIGGVKVVVGDQVMDASIRGRLEAMTTALMN